MGYHLVDRFGCPCRDVFWRVRHLGAYPETSTAETQARELQTFEYPWTVWTACVWTG